jgi:hypothetical protein
VNTGCGGEVQPGVLQVKLRFQAMRDVTYPTPALPMVAKRTSHLASVRKEFKLYLRDERLLGSPERNGVHQQSELVDTR